MQNPKGIVVTQNFSITALSQFQIECRSIYFIFFFTMVNLIIILSVILFSLTISWILCKVVMSVTKDIGSE